MRYVPLILDSIFMVIFVLGMLALIFVGNSFNLINFELLAVFLWLLAWCVLWELILKPKVDHKLIKDFKKK